MPNIEQQILDANILIVDDNATNIELLLMMLEGQGFHNLFSTTDSRKVTDIFREKTIDIILLDIRMPHMDGFQVMEELKPLAHRSYLPILVMTAQNDEETRHRALQSGAKDFLTKPFDNTEAISRITNMLEVRMLYNERIRQTDDLELKVLDRTTELRETNHQLRETRRAIIDCLGRASEFRDNETGVHVIRMSMACGILARAIGLPEDEAELIQNASPMHDVGKLGIPDEILLKPGRHTPEETKIMQTHAEIGAHIMSSYSSDITNLAQEIALTHHENWDGSGYPKGLSGETIPLSGRISAICDVYDALTSKRPYKKAWSQDDAANFIRGQSGKKFDPVLVEAFLNVLPDVNALRDQYPDPEDE